MIKSKTIFDQNLDLLIKSISKSDIKDPFFEGMVMQLRYIYNVTEKAWYKNLERLKNSDKEIKYLLICEAPPWSDSDPHYFYINPQGQLFNTVRLTFFADKPCTNPYTELATKRFLLIDSLPVSIKYNTKHRKSAEYLQLIELSKQWWIDKLNNSGLTFANDLKIAFGYYWNGKRIIEESRGKIKIKKHEYDISCINIISHKKSRYLPDYIRLRDVFSISP